MNINYIVLGPCFVDTIIIIISSYSSIGTIIFAEHENDVRAK